MQQSTSGRVVSGTCIKVPQTQLCWLSPRMRALKRPRGVACTSASLQCHQRLRCSARMRAYASMKSPSSDKELLCMMSSRHNHITVLKISSSSSAGYPLAGSTALFLDESVHSIYRDDRMLIGKEYYWDHLALIAELAPDGPIGILGLGSATTARIIHEFWPDRKMHGWELDALVLEVGRDHMGMQPLEDAGALVCHVGDALAPDAAVEGGFAGIIVDLFASGSVIDPLNKVEAWKQVRRKLRPGGQMIANLGKLGPAAFCARAAFQGMDIYIKQTAGNVLAVTGGDPARVRQKLGDELKYLAEDWAPQEKVLSCFPELQTSVDFSSNWH